MRLCFDATKFGTGLDGAIELAASKGIPAVEYSFAPFTITNKSAARLDSKELAHLHSIHALSCEKNIQIACLDLDYCLVAEDKKSARQFGLMIAKLAKVAAALDCRRISIALQPGANGTWKEAAEQVFAGLDEVLIPNDVRLLLRLSTPAELRGLSLKHWQAMEPQDWRDLLSVCPNLGLSFSPADCVWLGIDYLKILSGLASAIEHVEAHDIEVNREMLMDSGMFGPLWWRYRLVGKGQVDWRQLIEALKLYDFHGTFSVHLDDEFIGTEVEELSDALDSSLKVVSSLVSD